MCPTALRTRRWRRELTETWPQSDCWQVCRESVTQLALVPEFERGDGCSESVAGYEPTLRVTLPHNYSLCGWKYNNFTLVALWPHLFATFLVPTFWFCFGLGLNTIFLLFIFISASFTFQLHQIYEYKNGSVWRMGKVEETQNKNLNRKTIKKKEKGKPDRHTPRVSAVCIYKGD